jgi:hypothetical protein
MRRAAGVLARILLLGSALTLQAACGGTTAPGGLPADAITGPAFPIDAGAAFRISREALGEEVRPDLIEAVRRPYPGHRGWLRFVVGLDSLTLFAVPRQAVDAEGEVQNGHAFAAWYDGSCEPAGRATARRVLAYAHAAAARLAHPLAPLPTPRAE